MGFSIALGFDRPVMLVIGADHIEEMPRGPVTRVVCLGARRSCPDSERQQQRRRAYFVRFMSVTFSGREEVRSPDPELQAAGLVQPRLRGFSCRGTASRPAGAEFATATILSRTLSRGSQADVGAD